MKYELHTDCQRINLMYDLMHHSCSPVELTNAYDINYNTIRNMYNLYILCAFLIFLRFAPLLDKMPLSKHAIDRSEYVSQNLLDQHKSSKTICGQPS